MTSPGADRLDASIVSTVGGSVAQLNSNSMPPPPPRPRVPSRQNSDNFSATRSRLSRDISGRGQRAHSQTYEHTRSHSTQLQAGGIGNRRTLQHVVDRRGGVGFKRSDSRTHAANRAVEESSGTDLETADIDSLNSFLDSDGETSDRGNDNISNRGSIALRATRDRQVSNPNFPESRHLDQKETVNRKEGFLEPTRTLALPVHTTASRGRPAGMHPSISAWSNWAVDDEDGEISPMGQARAMAAEAAEQTKTGVIPLSPIQSITADGEPNKL
jgi:hypothetical protein